MVEVIDASAHEALAVVDALERHAGQVEHAAPERGGLQAPIDVAADGHRIAWSAPVEALNRRRDQQRVFIARQSRYQLRKRRSHAKSRLLRSGGNICLRVIEKVERYAAEAVVGHENAVDDALDQKIDGGHAGHAPNAPGKRIDLG